MAIYFDLETRTFGVILNSIGNSASKWLGSEKANKTNMAMTLGTTALGLGITAYKGLQKTKFSVVGLVNGKPTHKTISANSPMEAVSKVKQSNANLTSARAFRLPDQDNQSQDYYESLLSKN